MEHRNQSSYAKVMAVLQTDSELEDTKRSESGKNLRR